MNATALSTPVFTAQNVTKAFPGHTALRDVTLEIPTGRVVGLLGRNGAGKSTLLNLMAGLTLPTTGTCQTLGRPSGELEAAELTHLGLVQQEGRFIEWMTVRQQLEFSASFYPGWDHALQARLVESLEVPVERKLGHLSPGDRQKVSLLLGVCHRPALLLLDEPMSALDPIARTRALDLLLDRLRDDGCTVVISSHLLEDVEKIVDWVVAVEAGRIVESCAFDELQESFAEWTFAAAPGRTLPARFTEPYILTQEIRGAAARLQVRLTEPDAADTFASTHGVELAARPLNLGEMFPLLVTRGGTAP